MVAATSLPVTRLSLDSLLAALPELTPQEQALIERAYHRAEALHAGQRRRNGDPYVTHPLAVAHILAEMKLDAEAIAAALLHDVLEDNEEAKLEDLVAEFGTTVANIVNAVTKLKNLPVSAERSRKAADREKEYIRKMVLAMGDDVRVVLVKLADRLHNMRTLHHMEPDKQLRIAQETMDIFAPLASRLGIWQMKWELEDLSFRYLQPEKYRMIAAKLDERRADRQKYLDEVINLLRVEMEKYGITNAKISGRPKHIYSIYKKMERKHLPFEEIYDVRAIRVIVDEVAQCYTALGVVHQLWRPVPGEFDDYISAPKDNFYQSLHTAVRDSKGRTLEVQIRTRDMNEHAEYGIAAHWRYKEGRKGKGDTQYNNRIEYLRRLLEFGREAENADEFMQAMTDDVFKDRVYVQTPRADTIDLPAGATPIDFAYYIHTDIGHRCRGAKVNGSLVSLDTPLKTGDRVEIITTKSGGPSLDWLNQNLGYVTTPRARNKINHWFRRQNRQNHISSGRDVLERELKRLGVLEMTSFEQVAALFNIEKVDDFLAQIGAGDINGGQIANKILEAERKEQEARDRETLKVRPASAHVVTDASNAVSILSNSGLLVNIARCCNPMQGDPIIGYVTRGRGVTVHRRDCPNLGSETERMLEVTWDTVTTDQKFSVPIEITAYDREGLMRDVSTVMANEGINMTDVVVGVRNNIATFRLLIEIGNVKQLTKVLSRLSNIASVVDARRRLVN